MSRRRSGGNAETNPSKQAKASNKKESRVFKTTWLLDKDFQDFLIQKVNPQDNLDHTFCNACSVFICNKKFNISSHMKTKDHKEAMERYVEKQQQEHGIAAFLNNPVENQAKSLELRLALLVSQKNLDFSLPQEIISVFKKELPNNPVLNRVYMGKTKTSNVIREAVGKFVTTEWANRVRSTFYSVIVDESPDISTKNKMAVVLSFWDGKLNSEMIKMKRYKDATAQGLFTALQAELARSNIPERQMVGFSADTCNAMFGERNSVSQKLKAFALLSSLVEEFLRQLTAFFTSSYKNMDELATFQEFCETAQHTILKPGLTRWLTLQSCAARVLEQYSPLLLFFTSLVNEKPNDSNMKMLSLLYDPFTKCYLEFLVYVLEKFNKFNVTFQNNKPLLHELQDYVYHLILDLYRSFMDGAFVNSLKSFPLTIDPR